MNNIKELILNAERTPQEIADALGVDKRTVQRWIAGSSMKVRDRIALEQVCRLARESNQAALLRSKQ